MFKERLKTTGMWLLENTVIPPIFFIVVIGAGLWLFMKFPILAVVGKWLCVIGLGCLILLAIVLWINWQFIEPYTEWRKKKKWENTDD